MTRLRLTAFVLASLVVTGCPGSEPAPTPTPTPDATLVDVVDDGSAAPDAVADATPDADPPDAVADAVEETSEPDVVSDATDVSTSDAPTDGEADTTADAEVDVEPPPPAYLECDAGDEAWVMRTLPMLLGRPPRGIQEVRVLAQMAAQSSRRAVAMGLMQQAGFTYRWRTWLMDELRVNRVGSKMHNGCYGGPMQTEHDGSLATFVRDNPAAGAGPGAQFNMTDLVLSALALDDLSPIWRAHLFAMMSKPLTGANVDAVAMDITRRQDFGEIFEATYLHRNVVCAGCHNGQWGMTDHPDPELDKHWALPGRPEKALYGFDEGIQEMTFYSVFRHLGVVGGPMRPWQLDDSCGDFVAEAEVNTDPADFEAFFIKERGRTASIWQVERALYQGFDKLRNAGKVTVGPKGELDGAEAFAYLVSQRIANRVWREVMGYSLTVVHYIPRNEEQKDLLLQLTNRLITTSWSLKELLADIVTHPLYNETAPAEGCGTDGPYYMPPVFNPWILLEPEGEQGNSPGDVLHRYDARLLLQMISQALDWPLPSTFPEPAEENFQKAVGVFVKDAEPGFDGVDFQGLLTFESRFADCQKPNGQPDWLDILGLQAEGDAATTVRDLASAIKNRLVALPDLGADEEPLIAELFGVASVDTALTDAADWQSRSRMFCGVLLQSPQFLLTGVAPPAQQTTPGLELPGETFEAQCEAWENLLDDKAWTVACAPGGVVVTPFAPPLGGL